MRITKRVQVETCTVAELQSMANKVNGLDMSSPLSVLRAFNMLADGSAAVIDMRDLRNIGSAIDAIKKIVARYQWDTNESTDVGVQ